MNNLKRLKELRDELESMRENTCYYDMWITSGHISLQGEKRNYNGEIPVEKFELCPHLDDPDTNYYVYEDEDDDFRIVLTEAR